MEIKQLVEMHRRRIKKEEEKRKIILISSIIFAVVVLVVFANAFQTYIATKRAEQMNEQFMKVGLEFLNVTDYKTSSGFETKLITLLNIGESQLSNFTVLLNDKEIVPYFVTDVAYPNQEINLILFPEQAREWQTTEGIIELVSKEKASMKIKAVKVSVTGNFVYVI